MRWRDGGGDVSRERLAVGIEAGHGVAGVSAYIMEGMVE
jgi:hypothetical protein